MHCVHLFIEAQSSKTKLICSELRVCSEVKGSWSNPWLGKKVLYYFLKIAMIN